MVIIKNGKMSNTPESDKYVNQFLIKQPKILIKISETGEFFGYAPYVTETSPKNKK